MADRKKVWHSSFYSGQTMTRITSRKNHIFAIAVILIISFCVYARSIGFDFLITWDDDVYITQNDAIKGFSIPTIAAAFSSFYVGIYAPVLITSYMLDYSIWGLNPAGFHLSNILLHSMNGVILFFLMTRLKLSTPAAAAASILFLIHPVQVETVAWITERKNILGLLFMLLSLHSWIQWREHPGEEGKKRYYWLAVFLFLLSLLSKGAITFVFPLLLAAYSYSYDNAFKPGKLLSGISPFFALSVIFSLMALFAQSAEFSGGRIDQQKGVWFFTMPPVFAAYIGHVLWPDDLLPSYLPGYRNSADSTVLLSISLLVLFFTAVILLIRRERKMLFWFSCILVPMLPVSHIIPFITLMNDRYLYIPMTGVAGVAAFYGDRILLKADGVKKNVTCAIVIGVLIAIGALSFQQTGIWKNDVTLWTYLIDRSAPNALFYWRLGEAHRLSGNPAASMDAYGKALEINPENLRAHRGAAEALLQLGQPERAIPHAMFIVRKLPTLHLGFTLLGEAYIQMGERDKAGSALGRAIQLSPKDARTAAALQTLAK